MIGGRNIANDYFDLSEHYNFLDSDVLITGEVVGRWGRASTCTGTRHGWSRRIPWATTR